MRWLAAFAIVASLLLAATSTPSHADPQVTERVEHYIVSATNRRELLSEMRRKGPRGYWARTIWTVRWSGDCKVTVDILYILPKHQNLDRLSPALRKSFTKAMARLDAHEKQHGQHGMQAAQALEAADCKGAKRILSKFKQADRLYDQRTNHGAREGVRLN